VHGIVAEWVGLKRWLDASVAQPAIQVTLPDREAAVASCLAKFADGGAG
jgi:hypothetical protein